MLRKCGKQNSKGVWLGGGGVDLDPMESIVSLILQGTLECRLCLRVVPASAKEAGLLDPCTRQSLAL